MIISKIKSYIGFAIKSRTIIYGVDSIKEKKVKVIFFSESLSDSSKNNCEKIANKNNCKYYQLTDEQMLELTQNNKIKAFAITNSDLAAAIEKNM